MMTIIGRKELIKIPIIGNEYMVAKIDTGAYSNSIHCDRVEANEIGLDIVMDNKTVIRLNAGEYKYKSVKSSNGIIEVRVTTKLNVVFNNKKYKTMFTFTNRDNMSSKILIGRKFLSKRYIVDVAKTNTLKKGK
jgi:hypothetical protein